MVIRIANNHILSVIGALRRSGWYLIERCEYQSYAIYRFRMHHGEVLTLRVSAH